MKTFLIAATFAAALAAAPAWAADQQEGPNSEDTYVTMFAYSQTSPHAHKVPAAVEQSADMKAAEAERREVDNWSTVMGRSDRPQEYLGSGHK